MRSLLFVPGDSSRKFEKAQQGKADVLILDLEDSVAPEQKEQARAATRAMLASQPAGQLLYVRVNALDSGLTLADLNAVMPAAPDGIVLPKCRSGADVKHLALWLDAFETSASLATGSTRIIAIVTETAESLFGLHSYGECSPRLTGIMWGAEDLAASLGATENSSGGSYHGPYRLARDLTLTGAAAAGVAAIDTVFVDIANLSALEVETRSARRDGFSAKAVIHPSHVDVVNRAFEPTPEERIWARQVVDALSGDSAPGVVKINGKMIDKPHLRAALRLLAIPEKNIGTEENDSQTSCERTRDF